MASVDVDQADNGLSDSFVDRVECKILSPTKETISPSKIFGEALARNGQASAKEVQNNTERDQMNESKDDSLDSSVTDSGLETSGSAESHDERFIDRQESIVEPENPEQITSPSKVISQAFNFIDNEAQSLDAMNNNSEAAVQDDAADAVPFNDDDLNQNTYLGVEVSLHDSVQVTDKEEADDKEKVKGAETDVVDTSMNLYWYSNTMDLDPAELEQFKCSQTETAMSNTSTDAVDDYYKDKLGTEYPVSASENKEIQSAPPDQSDMKENWSPVFESASSHCLVVATEMKSDPKTLKNRENTSIKESENQKKQHPWGLDTDQKMKVECGNNVSDDLPSLVLMPSSEVEHIVDVIDGTPEPTETRNKVPADQMADNRFENVTLHIEEQTENGDDSNGEDKWVNIEITDPTDLRNVSDLIVDEGQDVADAVGYMEMKDKPVQEIIEQSSAKGVESKVIITKGGDASGKDSKDIQMTGNKDIPNEVGYMDIKDKPTEQVIKATTSKGLESKNIFPKGASMVVGMDVHDGPDQMKIEPIEESIVSEVSTLSEASVSAGDIKQPEVDIPTQVERKFRIADDTETKVLEHGGTLVETHTFIDEYIDDDHYTLLLRDSWLRLRNKKFEMKVNAPVHSSTKCLQYNEVTNEKEIKDTLLKWFKGGKDDARLCEQPLDVVVDELGLSEFVTFTTTRKIFKLQGGVVKLDLSDSGVLIGEISVQADRLKELPTALGVMGKIAGNLGMTPLQGV